VKHIFVSYSRKDEETIAKIVERLDESRMPYWWDKELKAGQNFSMEIEKQIGDAHSVLVAWSPAARASVYVRGEALAALDQKKLKQAMLDDAPPPVPFNAEHAVKLKGWSGAADDPRWIGLVEQLSSDAPASRGTGSARNKRARNREIVRAGASSAQLASLWLVPLLMVVMLSAGLWLGINKDVAPFGIARENLFLGVGGGVVLLLAVFVALLASTMLSQLNEVDPRNASSK